MVRLVTNTLDIMTIDKQKRLLCLVNLTTFFIFSPWGRATSVTANECVPLGRRVQQMGRGIDRSMCRLRLPPETYDSVQGGPHMPLENV